MNTMKLRVLFLFAAGFIMSIDARAQCAMCRATLENNVSNGDIGIAAGINFGILYLFAAPYVVISLIALLWYKTSKRTAQDENKGSLAR